jgi:hypothetical protein
MVTRRKLLAVAAGVATTMLSALGNTRAQPGGRPKRLVLVHGRSQQGRDAAVIKSEWVGALEAGEQKLGRALPSDIEIILPYYGDKLDSFAQQWNIPVNNEIRARGPGEDDDFLQFQAQVAEALRTKAQITDEQVNAEYGTNPRPRGPLNWDWVQAILRALDRYGPGMSKSTVEIFTRDVFLYATRAGIQDEIDRIVSKAFIDGEPTVVVGHSLGSVVAYNILRRDRGHLKVPLYVTVGSPLGIRAIREQFLPLRFPAPPLGAWFNAFDTRDAIALYPLDQYNFPVTTASENYTIENYSGVKNHTDNRHGIVGYLDDPEVAKRILNAVLGT